MDSTFKKRCSVSDHLINPAGILFVCLIVLSLIFVFIGSNFSESNRIFDDCVFYERYNGLDTFSGLSGLLQKLSVVTGSSVPFYVQTAAIFLMSFSSLLLPSVFLLVAYRGFIIGSAFSAIEGPEMLVQLICYIFLTVVISLMSAVLSSFRTTDASDTVRVTLKKLYIFFICTGICTVSEFMLTVIL